MYCCSGLVACHHRYSKHLVGTKSSVSCMVSIAFRCIIPGANQKQEKKNSFCTIIVAGDL